MVMWLWISLAAFILWCILGSYTLYKSTGRVQQILSYKLPVRLLYYFMISPIGWTIFLWACVTNIMSDNN